ncbi:MAG TPA: pseudouridine synthase [Balneolaceae bacterium]|nr:pseudouridine synthase [Balneolaceae bacterium]
MNKKRKRPSAPKKSGTTRRKNQRNRDKSFSISPTKVPQKEYLKDEIRLNKYIAHAGFCSRRDADTYISEGRVKVNGKTVTELGVKVQAGDSVTVDGQSVSLEPFVYILLNKGKDTISTTDDEKDRNTVLDVVSEATGQRVYPVGRLDRDTMGLLILTNDGDLAHRLMHPSYTVKKTYDVTTNKLITDEQIDEYRQGITLEDGPFKPVSVKRDVMNPFVLTVSVHEGRNHLIRRMIRYMGAEVVKLKRVRYAGLNEKNLRVGRWRFLKQKEINDLRKLVKLEPLNFKKE